MYAYTIVAREPSVDMTFDADSADRFSTCVRLFQKCKQDARSVRARVLEPRIDHAPMERVYA
jgi:hypothetical protein